MSIWSRTSSAESTYLTIQRTTGTSSQLSFRWSTKQVKKPKAQVSGASVPCGQGVLISLNYLPSCRLLLDSFKVFFFQSNQHLYLVQWTAFSKREICPWTHRSISQVLQPRFTEQALKFLAGAGVGTQLNCPVSCPVPAHLWVHHTSPSPVKLSRFRSLQYNCLCTVHMASLKKKKV